MLSSLLVLAVLVAPALSSAGVAALLPDPRPVAVDDELVAEFTRFYGKDRSERERLEAVRVLEGVDTWAAARALLPAFEDESFNVRRAVVDVVGGYRSRDVAERLVEDVLTARKMSRRPELRAGVAEALGRMGHADVSYEALIELLDDRDEQVVLAGITALGELGDPRACDALAALAVGDDVAEAVGALGALTAIDNTELAQEAVVTALQHEEFRVRAAAIEAVLGLRLKAAVRPLIERMRVEQGRLSGDAYAALQALTMRKFADDPDTWESWWDRNEERFVLPDPEEIAAARKRLEAEGSRYSQGKSFMGVETTSENIMFVIDVSGSMETRFDRPERLEAMGRTYDSLQRLAIVKQELAATIDSLPETTHFNIIAFATDVDSWRKRAAPANILAKSNAKAWVEKLEPLGGEASSFRVTTGLGTGTTNEGATNTHLALMTAFGEPLEGKDTDAFVTGDPKNDVDTIFFLTDGDPTVGKTVDLQEIRSEVRRVNAYRGVQLHVIYVGSIASPDMERLARENGGVFVAIGG